MAYKKSSHASHIATCNGYGVLRHLHVHKDPTQPIVLRAFLTARKEDASTVRNTDLEAEVHTHLFDKWPRREKRISGIA